MKYSYSIFQGFIANILLVSLFLQSCTNISIPIQPTNHTHSVEELVNTQVSLQGESMSSLYEQNLQLQLEAKEEDKEPIFTVSNDVQQLISTQKNKSIKERQYALCKNVEALPSLLTYSEAIDVLQSNCAQIKKIDISQEKLDKNQLTKLKEAIKSNSVVGHISWGKIPPDCQELKKEIEEKLVQNTCNYRYYPNDYLHGLLANHVYNEPKEGDAIDLKIVATKLGHILPVNANFIWKVVQVIDDSKNSGYYSALYVNEAVHQAVLSFQGTHPERLVKDLLIEDLQGVLEGKVTRQQHLAYEATKAAAEYVGRMGFNLSMTGHSLGGYLAELSVGYYYNYNDSIKPKGSKYYEKNVVGIVFDSPGATRKLDSFKIDKEHLPIIAYLSAPNLVNSCDKHLADTYRVFPKLEEWLDWKKSWNMEEIGYSGISSIVDNDILRISKAIKPLHNSHSLETILRLFDVGSGKPKEYVRIASWPGLNLDHTTYVGKHKSYATGTLCSLGAILGATGGGQGWRGFLFSPIRMGLGGGIGCMAGYMMDNYLWPSLRPHLGQELQDTSIAVYGIATVLSDLNNINADQFWTTLRYLDGGFREPSYLSAENKFLLKYQGHYQESNLALTEYPVNTKRVNDDCYNIDCLLYKLYKHKDAINQLPDSSMEMMILRNILKDFKLEDINGHPHFSLTNPLLSIRDLRERIQRLLEISSLGKLEEILKESEKLKNEKNIIKRIANIYSDIALKKLAKLEEYIPRKKQEKVIDKQLANEGVCVLYGHGGCGKSTVAAKYVRDKHKNQTIWWVQADTRDKLLTGYQTLAKELGIDVNGLAEKYKESSDEHLSELAREIYSALESRKQYTLHVLDNAEDGELIADCLSHRTSAIQVIITTRDKVGFTKHNPIEIGAFSYEEARTYVKKNLSSILPSEQDIEALISEVGTIPKKLNLAVSYINEINFMNVDKYITKLKALKTSGKKQNGKLALPEAALGLESLDVTPQLLMRYGVHLDPDFIPLTLVSSLLKVDDLEKLDDILKPLERLSLITIIDDGSNRQGISLHREVQAECKVYSEWREIGKLSNQDLLKELIDVLDKSIPRVSRTPDNTWNRAQLYTPTLLHVLSDVEVEPAVRSLSGKLFELAGEYSHQVQLNYLYALEYYNKSLEIRRVIHIGNHPDVANLLNDIGSVHWDLGNYAEALEYYNQALKMRQAIYSGNHPDVATLLNDIGNVYEDLGKHAKALEYLDQALKMKKAIYAGNHLSVAISLNNIGNVYEGLKNHEKALEYYNQALVMNQALYSDEHPDIAISFNNIGLVYKYLGQHQKALEYYNQALVMEQILYKDKNGGNHPHIATSLNNIGGIYYSLGENEKALEYLDQAHKIKKAIYAGNHPDVTLSLHNIGRTYYRLGNDEKALEYHEQALQMGKAIYPSDHPKIATLFNNIASVYDSLGNYKKASEYRKQINKDKDETSSLSKLNESPTISPDSISNSITNYASKSQVWWNDMAKWVKSLLKWTEESPTQIDTDKTHARKLQTLQCKCKEIIQQSTASTSDKWYVYSLEDMIEDIDEVLREEKEIDNDTLKHFKKRLSGIQKDFIETDTHLHRPNTPYSLGIGQLKPTELLFPEMVMLNHVGGHMPALTQ